MTVRLWHKDYGFLRMFDTANNQWLNIHTGVRYGSFHADFHNIPVNLPLDEVIIDQP